MCSVQLHRPPGCVIAIDPGNKDSAFVVLENGVPVDIGLHDNEFVLALLDYLKLVWPDATLVIEMIACYGMPVGSEVFDTCVWIGRFTERWTSEVPPAVVEYVFRKDVKMNLCQNMRAKDANIRQALIDRFGGKEAGVGNKKDPGPLHGVKKDIWSALAVGLTYIDGKDNGRCGEETHPVGRKSEV